MKNKFIQAIFLSFAMLFTLQVYAADIKSPITDTVITGKVKSKIALDPSLSVFQINVLTKKGIVYLSGRVNSETDADAVVQLAQATEGVRDVSTANLSVKGSDKPFTDTLITSKIKGLLIRNKIVGENVTPLAVHVETNNGVVYLSGNVDTQAQADNAIRLAKSVKGVKEVQSRLEVNTHS